MKKLNKLIMEIKALYYSVVDIILYSILALVLLIIILHVIKNF